MTSNLPEKFLANWALNDIVMPPDVNKWETTMNTLNDAIRIYASTGSFYVINSFDTSSSSDLINLVPVSYQSSNNETLTEYRDGMEINFLCSVVGSSKYVDVNVANLGVKQIKKVDSQTRITGNDLIQGFYLSLIYSSSQNCFYLNSSTVSTDGETINENSSHRIQTIGIIDDNTGTALKQWTGTRAQYDALVANDDIDSDTIYDITDDTFATDTLLNLLYPVGSIYIGTMATCPLAALGIGSWLLVATDRVLQGAGTRGSVGSTVNESLPNITGALGQGLRAYGDVTSGALYGSGGYNTAPNNGGYGAQSTINIDASRSSSTYQDNAPVQQDAYLVNIWERIS